MNNLLNELKRRNVFRIAMVYAVAGWVLMQVGIALETTLNLPGWFDTLVTVLILIGLPIALILAWAFEMTPDGVKPTIEVTTGDSITPKTGRKLNYTLMGALAIAVGLLGWQNFRSSPTQSTETQIAETQVTVTAPSNQMTEATTEKQSIAVLPFEDFSEDKTQDYFARGISEELLNVLARIDGLRVASRTSAFAFKDEGKSVSEIAEALNVAHVLEGSIRKSGTTLRITAQLIDTSNDEHLWSDTYDRPLTAENLFQIQDEISEAIVTALKGQLTIKPPEASGRTLSLEAYETYLKAREDHNKRLPGPLAAAEAGFKKVIQLDPNFAPAHSGLADTYLLSDDYAGMDNQDALRLAEVNVKRALELAPNSAEALTSASMLENSKGGDPDIALDYAARAIAANPNYSAAYHRQGLAYNSNGELSLGLEAFQKGLSLDPESIILQNNIAFTQSNLGDFDGARASFEAMIRNHPEAPQGYNGLTYILYEIGDYENMHRALKNSQALNPQAQDARVQLSRFYVELGLYGQTRSVMDSSLNEVINHTLSGDKALARETTKSLTNPFDRFRAYYFLGDQSQAYIHVQDFIESAGGVNGIPPEVVQSNTDDVATIAHIYARADDPYAAIIMNQLDDYFQGRGPADFTRIRDLMGGARLELAKGNPKAALPWVERMMDLGLINNVLDFAPYDALRVDPEFIALVARNTEKRVSVRKAIEAQLESPPENWLKADSP